MTLTAYRIVNDRFASTAFDGEGARLHGGRWNSMGTRMVYTSESIALATLDLLVHLGNLSLLRDDYVVIPISFREALVKKLLPQELPREWKAQPIQPRSQQLGDKWVAQESSVVLAVPSVVIPQESNFLVNPAHPRIAEIGVGQSFRLGADSRLAPVHQ